MVSGNVARGRRQSVCMIRQVLKLAMTCSMTQRILLTCVLNSFCQSRSSPPAGFFKVNIHVPVRVIGMPGQREAAGEVYGGSGIGGIHGLPARASWMA